MFVHPSSLIYLSPKLKTMQKLFLPVLFCVLAVGMAFGQEPSKNQLAPCGTAPYLDAWLRDFRANPEKFAAADRSSDTLWVAMKIHLLAKDNGVGRFSPERLLNAFCRLNADYAPSKIQFYFKDDWNLLNNTAWYDHNDIETGIQMMLTNDVPHAVNSYFVSDPAGNCGYNLPYAGVAMAHGCAGPEDHTWAHEVGHNLTLPHPFIGWEGKIYNFSTPTPTFLTYDYTHFHAQPDTIVPAPLDTALVERLDGSNCGIAADRFCDTRPDYLSYRWDCDAQNQSLVRQKDPAGAEFFSDGTLFMSYAFDRCQSRFSDEEIAAMRANLQTVKNSYIAPGPVAPPIAGLPTLIEPIGGETVPKDGTTLHWSAVPGATKYLLQISRVASFAFKDVEVVVADTFFTTSTLPVNYNMYWRVRPFNAAYACAGYTPSEKFYSSNLSSTDEAEDFAGFRLYPSVSPVGGRLHLEASLPQVVPVFCRVVDVAGRTIWQGNLGIKAGKNRLPFDTNDWQSGVYRAVFYQPDGAFFAKTFLLAK